VIEEYEEELQVILVVERIAELFSDYTLNTFFVWSCGTFNTYISPVRASYNTASYNKILMVVRENIAGNLDVFVSTMVSIVML
jgi:hypothetical protein